MNTKIDLLRKANAQALQLFDNYSEEQLNLIPAGFNNNIIWNLAHLVASDAMILYSATGNTSIVPATLVQSYKRGTRPEGPVDAATLALVKELMVNTIDNLEKDQQNGIFQQYTTWTTSFGHTISSIDDAVTFCIYHHGMHGSAISALRKFIQ
ncbi:DinB family protein [Chitinophaga sp. Cy-1792]|uniref:DinB family protein n=1 Tax=Chitinophaga sp. Cy-1792 TaxID=2608339 RepID=UPI00141F6508|nr:DinB family protein [Chitinophaga sp. Cy-1792]NIG55585.1 DinB family protein [Chitinophaga sp. Cy-1792]